MKTAVPALLAMSLLRTTGPLLASPEVLKGRVVDTNGRPVGGINLYLLHWKNTLYNRAPEILARSTGGSEGYYTFKPIELSDSDKYRIVGYRPGKWLGWCVDIGRQGHAVRPGEPAVTMCQTVVSKLHALVGCVTDADGKPLPHASVSVSAFYAVPSESNRSLQWDPHPMPSDATFGPAVWHYPETTSTKLQGQTHADLSAELLAPVVKLGTSRTDAKGRFSIDNVPEHIRSIVRVSHQGSAMQEMPAEYLCNATRIVMVKAGAVTGQLVDKERRPVAGATVTKSWSPYVGAEQPSTVTDKKGTFRIELLPGTHNLDFVLDKTAVRGPYLRNVEVRAGRETNVGQILAEPARLVGRLLDEETGSPVQGGLVKSDIGRFAPTDLDGSFDVPVWPGTNMVFAFLPADGSRGWPGAASVRILVDVPPEGLSGLEMKLQKPARVCLQVHDPSGLPLSSTLVSMGVENDTTGPDGMACLEYRNEEFPSAKYPKPDDPMVRISAFCRFKRLAGQETVARSLLMKNTVVLTLSPYRTVKVTVKDSNGDPLDRAHVRATDALVAEAYTDAEGTCLVDAFQDKRPVISVAMKGYRSNQLRTNTSTDEDLAVVLQPIKPVKPLTGRIVDGRGKPVPDAFVTLSDGEDKASCRSESDGAFSLCLASPNGDQFYLSAVSPERNTGAAAVIPAGSLLTKRIVLTEKPLLDLRVRVRDAQGSPVRDALVTATSTYAVLPSSATRGDGTAIVNGVLPDGRYSLRAERKGYTGKEVVVQKAGGGKAVELVLEREALAQTPRPKG